MEKKIKIQTQTYYTRDNLFEDMVTKQHPVHYHRIREAFPYVLVDPIRIFMYGGV